MIKKSLKMMPISISALSSRPHFLQDMLLELIVLTALCTANTSTVRKDLPVVTDHGHIWVR